MKGTRRVSLIAAVAENGVIGRKGALPWRIPEDFRFYLDKVRDQIIILGRHCFYEADHPAALTIALSRNPQWQPSPLKVPSIHISTSFSFFLHSWACTSFVPSSERREAVHGGPIAA